MKLLSAPDTVLLSVENREPSLLMAGALTTFVTVMVSVAPPEVPPVIVDPPQPLLPLPYGGWLVEPVPAPKGGRTIVAGGTVPPAEAGPTAAAADPAAEATLMAVAADGGFVLAPYGLKGATGGFGTPLIRRGCAATFWSSIVGAGAIAFADNMPSRCYIAQKHS
jgi:hypothetical protein